MPAAGAGARGGRRGCARVIGDAAGSDRRGARRARSADGSRSTGDWRCAVPRAAVDEALRRAIEERGAGAGRRRDRRRRLRRRARRAPLVQLDLVRSRAPAGAGAMIVAARDRALRAPSRPARRWARAASCAAAPSAAEHRHLVDIAERSLRCSCVAVRAPVPAAGAALSRGARSLAARPGASRSTSAPGRRCRSRCGWRSSSVSRAAPAEPALGGVLSRARRRHRVDARRSTPGRSWPPRCRSRPPSSPTSRRCSSPATATAASTAMLVPVAACYELVGRVKRCWRGFDGGDGGVGRDRRLLRPRARAQPSRPHDRSSTSRVTGARVEPHAAQPHAAGSTLAVDERQRRRARGPGAAVPAAPRAAAARSYSPDEEAAAGRSVRRDGALVVDAAAAAVARRRRCSCPPSSAAPRSSSPLPCSYDLEVERRQVLPGARRRRGAGAAALSRHDLRARRARASR